jgi:hypothetical protein
MTMKKLVLVVAMISAAAACGGKSNGPTGPTNTAPSGSGSMGGTTYGGAGSGSAAPMTPTKTGGGDPCGG